MWSQLKLTKKTKKVIVSLKVEIIKYENKAKKALIKLSISENKFNKSILETLQQSKFCKHRL